MKPTEPNHISSDAPSGYEPIKPETPTQIMRNQFEGFGQSIKDANNLNKQIELLQNLNNKNMKTYCVNVKREIEEPFIFHFKTEDNAPEPTRHEVLKKIDEQDCGYDDNYGKFEFWEVK